jgi:hypothetical protein
MLSVLVPTFLYSQALVCGCSIARLRVRIPFSAWMFISCVVSCVRSCLCNELITTSKDSYRLCGYMCVI